MYFSDSCQYNIAVSFCPNAMGQNETKTTFCFRCMTARIFNVTVTFFAIYLPLPQVLH